jgi:succinate dehydrogenase / fumarate reductase cytochrome b subunit
MSLSGLFLILFLTVHMTANFTILWGEEIFTAVTDFMGNNPVIKMIVPVLAAGFIIHIFYAFYLSLKNLKARGEVKYKSVNRTAGLWIDHWASRNMLILG